MPQLPRRNTGTDSALIRALSGTPKTDVTVDVTAPLPNQTAPWPANTDEILLGKNGQPPTGFVQPSGEGPGSMPASYAGAYDALAAVAPELAKRTPPMWDLGDPTGAMRKLFGLASYVPALDATVFTEKPGPERMAHETIHRMQMQNFPSRAEGLKAWNPRGTGELAYLDAPGEQQAFKVEELIKALSEKRRK